MADKHEQSACGVSVAVPIEADISLSDGPGAMGARFNLRGTVLTILLPRGEDGAFAGQYRLNLDKRAPLLAALASLPATVVGPPPSPGMPVASFVVRDRGQEQRLVAPRPTADPQIDKILGELGRCEKAAKPVLTLALEIRPLIPAKPGEPQKVTVRIAAKGEPSAEVSFNPGSIRLQAAAEPKPAPAGVTPLPPEWEQVSAPLSGPSPQSLKPGATTEVTMTVNVPAPEPRWLRVVYDGNATFRVPSHADEIRLGLVSKAVRLAGSPMGARNSPAPK